MTESGARTTDAESIDLSLVSHTNVGKTTLARTLLRTDIGEVRDAAHVTEVAEGHVLIESARGDTLRLWDTPGFGDSVRLLKRLRASANPIGWLLSHVWDRFTDRPFYSSQQAVRNVRDTCDIVLYLVNAAEDPASAGYVDAEMQILAWLDKPVVLLLNQIGPPRGSEADAQDEAAWRTHLRAYPLVRGVISLDAFARCWVQEDELLAAVGGALRAETQPTLLRLRRAWRERNLEVFHASMRTLSAQLASAALDREPIDPRSRPNRVKRWFEAARPGGTLIDAGSDRAMQTLARRLEHRLREATDTLIRLHGLSGSATEEIFSRMASQYDERSPADVTTSGVFGGILSGALGGLTADLAAGGLTAGAGALIGAILGAFGAGGAARVYNLARNTLNGSVGWSGALLEQLVATALLRYLAVAHFGRGRGDWVTSEYPKHWRALVEQVVAVRHAQIEAVWAARNEAGSEGVQRDLLAVLGEAARETLIRLYPGAQGIFAAAPIAETDAHDHLLQPARDATN